MTDTQPSLTERLATHWADLPFEQIPTDVVERVKDNILDTLAVALAGAGTDEATRVNGALADVQGNGSGSLVWGTPHRLSPAHAALANGTAAHARDFDDGGGPGHAGSTVLPAAIAVAEATGADGPALIAATIAGYDIGYRTLQSLGGFAAHTDRGWHSSGTMGSFAAAAASAKVLGLDAERFADALGIAGSFTGGVWAFIDDGAWTKRIHPGKAGETGADAALLARAGITGPRRIFEAEWGGLFALYNGGEGFPEKALKELGVDFNVASAYIKPYACCRGSHSTIDAVLAMVDARDIRPQDVHRIVITAGETAVNMLSVDPIESVFDAQFSLPYAVAVALHHRRVGLDQFDPPRVGEPAVRATLDKISMQVDIDIQLEDGPLLEVEFTNGEKVTLVAGNPTTAKGSAESPLTHAEVVGKAEELLAPYGPSVADGLVRAVENLDNSRDLTELLRALRAGTRGD
ncbi:MULTISPECIES: MmgE/PrpD family protein [unclassified Streptomyces]|uniref:MmgE/PrpD family protein n=1 Tax=unclassified Streptomyces TaxID=2593676 RepID=UPI00224FDEF3|nr:MULTISPECIES: MmgE/PrpD family protein [unclassified Streptomyces]MCX5435646.1 MmgE/PrpD family protein [Streptomyces sp. NBC_00063]WSE08822.1 MmgE/PrpD family protein [Streptomyces sp. NBC_01445]WSE13442.1 MmgE/PrpD family protein [Streptomyces sp. NBC_01397]WUB97642.1 MmgE/PrpD family protein [Streptomyces sp. NBC_00569]